MFIIKCGAASNLEPILRMLRSDWSKHHMIFISIGRNKYRKLKATSNLLKVTFLVKVNFNFRSGMEINIMWCLDQSERSILRTGSKLDVALHLTTINMGWPTFKEVKSGFKLLHLFISI